MKSISFIDLEVNPKTNQILDIGGLNERGDTFHSRRTADFTKFITPSTFLCGHNIIKHDSKYINHEIKHAGFSSSEIVDTLFLSPLLFPKEPYHSLLKDDKLQTEELNNPVNDSLKAKDLFLDEVAAFNKLDEELKIIYYFLLKDKAGFEGFFQYCDFSSWEYDIEKRIISRFKEGICESTNLIKLISSKPIALAYSLALINTNSKYSITPPWVLKSFPEVERVMFLLRNNPCLHGCVYCKQALDIHKALKYHFGFDAYRSYGGKPLQEEAVQAAVDNKSLLAVFPTGGGKSITFQIPALMSGLNVKGLTVIISPLQSLMKDQVDNLEESNITDAVTINGLLDPIERQKSFERVENGKASILYISPESLRSRSIEKLILGRNVVRFVIDEAHCFSAWGQDFRVDYLYIADFIAQIQKKKNLSEPIPVSCFTATAKQNVIQDICKYFRNRLDLNLEVYSSKASRTNLNYSVIYKEDEEEKYNTLRNLIDEKECPTIIYVSRTKRAYNIAERLNKDGYNAKPYHGKMDKQEKSENQDAFIRGDVQIMVATSAFGMGVDKKDVGLVIHFEISDSLENYVQEAGRAGRDQSITADCYVLFNEEDLNKHFILLNQTKIHLKEIQQIWKAIKELTKFRSNASSSALEIARKAGWDDNIQEVETRVTTAIAALEEAGYVQRGQNMPQIFANSILSKNANEAIEKINTSESFSTKQKEQAARIIKKLFSSKSRQYESEEVAESRVDYISDHLGLVKGDVIKIVNLLKAEEILADTKDLTAYIYRTSSINQSLKIVSTFAKLEKELNPELQEKEKVFHLKKLLEQLEEKGCKKLTPRHLKTLLNFLAIKNLIKRKNSDYSGNQISIVSLQSQEQLGERMEKRHALAEFIIEYLFNKNLSSSTTQKGDKSLVEFSVVEIKNEYQKHQSFFKIEINLNDVEDALFYLSRIEAMKIEGGFLVVYNRLSLERLEKDNKKRYKIEDYKNLKQFYTNKVNQVHIVGEYAKRMVKDYKQALQFVDDYFQLNYQSFLNKYFNALKQEEINRNITPTKFRQLFGELSTPQLNVVKDRDNRYAVVAAGPGSGKTKVLVHKLASLLLMEDVKHEQLLMLTFSRAAATEFKQRLFKLIGNAAGFIEIKTFHSYCFDLLGKVGDIEKSVNIIKDTILKIKEGEVEINRITKAVLVIDEAQDMDADEFELINTLMDCNEEMSVIAVGDDDQNIYEFRGSSSTYMKSLITENGAEKFELNDNFRSKSNLVDFSNEFVKTIKDRIKSFPIVPKRQELGKLKLTKYSSKNLIKPLIQSVKNYGLSGTTCILTQTNEEALQTTGLLNKIGLHVKLIQSNDGFNLFNLIEVRYFIAELNLKKDTYTIYDEDWKNAKRQLWNKYQNSSNIDVSINLIKAFEASNKKKKFRTDFEIFVRESKLEDFHSQEGDIIYVSTIHKAKGKEFDNVFVLLDGSAPSTEEKKRLVYVAFTRAKNNLSVHYNTDFLDSYNTSNLKRAYNTKQYNSPNLMVLHLNHKDIWLGYFIHRYKIISNLMSGDKLLIDKGGLNAQTGEPLVKFSHQFNERIEKLNHAGYVLKEATVNYILYWHNEETEKEVKIVLPELVFEKNN